MTTIIKLRIKYRQLYTCQTKYIRKELRENLKRMAVQTKTPRILIKVVGDKVKKIFKQNMEGFCIVPDEEKKTREHK